LLVKVGKISIINYVKGNLNQKGVLNMVPFVCSSCKKKFILEKPVYEKAYNGHETCLDCRPKQGGYREGAGRPSLGTTKKVSITLSDEAWNRIEEEKGVLSMSGFLREVILKELVE
jgi:hypothetical protein